MRLVRNTTEDGRCKYALVRLDLIRAAESDLPDGPDEVRAALKTLEDTGFLEYAGKNDPEECFVIKLKDKFAARALFAYADEAASDPEYSREVRALAVRSMDRTDLKRPD